MFGIADNLQIEAHDFAGKRIGVVGKSGSGKTNTLLLTAELWMDNGWPVVIIDPMGELRSLKSAYPVLVVGAQDEDDLTIDESNAAQIAEFCFRQRLSVVLDMSMLSRKNDQDVNVLAAFLECFWDLVLAQKKTDAQPWAVMVDEAQLYAPQRGETPVSPTLIDMGKRGRHKNLTMVVATQRPASIQKDFLTQTNLVIWHQIMLGTDTALLQESLPLIRKDLNSMMRSFQQGEALVIGDGKLINGENYLIAQVYRSRTAAQDGATLERGELKAIDPSMMEALRKSLTKPAAQPASGDSLKVLREKEDEIKRLKRENLDLAIQRDQQKAKVEIKTIEVPVIRDEHMRELRMTAEQMIEHGQSLIGMGQEILMALKVKQQPTPAPQQRAADDGKLIAGAHKVLQALARPYPISMTRAQLGTLAGYTASGGTFGNYFGTLKKRGFLVEEAGQVSITEDGLSFLGTDIPPAPQTSDELLAMWQEVLSRGERAMLDVLVSVYPEWISREQLGQDAGYTASGGTFGNYLGTLRKNGLAVVEGQRVRASDTLFMDVRVR